MVSLKECDLCKIQKDKDEFQTLILKRRTNDILFFGRIAKFDICGKCTTKIMNIGDNERMRERWLKLADGIIYTNINEISDN